MQPKNGEEELHWVKAELKKDVKCNVREQMEILPYCVSDGEECRVG